MGVACSMYKEQVNLFFLGIWVSGKYLFVGLVVVVGARCSRSGLLRANQL